MPKEWQGGVVSAEAKLKDAEAMPAGSFGIQRRMQAEIESFDFELTGAFGETKLELRFLKEGGHQERWRPVLGMSL